ncbi:hypothetical protein WJX74_003057 [Apatococcus lobatus]|uniref:Uncharacterized protein n=1 Tax=Apatococcus lobatus TaxID=904363 RepID=A0AAW1QI27_9CHLO
MADEDALLAMKLHAELNPNTRRVSRRAADNPNKRQALQALSRKVQGTVSTASEDQTQNNSGLESSQGAKDRQRRNASGLCSSKPQQSEAGSDPPKQTGATSGRTLQLRPVDEQAGISKQGAFAAEAQAAAADAQRKARSQDSSQDMVKLFCQGIPWGVSLARSACLDQDALLLALRSSWPGLADHKSVQALVIDHRGGTLAFRLAGQNDKQDGWSKAAQQASRVYIQP